MPKQISQKIINSLFSPLKNLGKPEKLTTIKNLNPKNQPFWSKKLNSFLAVGSFLTVMTSTLPAFAAEQIEFLYDSLELTLKIESLQLFADEGIVNADLKDFFKIVKPSEEEKAKFRETLVEYHKFEPTMLSRLLNTDEGDRLLTKLGNIIQIQGGSNGKTVLRGSIIQAAAQPEGLTIINFLETLPTNMQVDIKKSMLLSEQVDFLLESTQEMIENTRNLAQAETSRDLSIDFTQSPYPGEPGAVAFVKETWELKDASRDRNFYVEIYRPQVSHSEKIPVIVFSHGLGEQPSTYQVIGELLASHGFLVVMPQHPGSDSENKKALFEGSARELFPLNEFIDRPLDIHYTIDELEKRNQTEFAGQLNLTNIGVFGHSFGGYTALAVAGATIDVENLAQDCAKEIGFFNVALLIQCRALKLQQPIPNLKDERIGAVLGFNPINASIFGPKGLANVKVPVFIGAGIYDLTTPFFFEHMQSFPWFVNAPESYLLLEEAGTHVSVIKLTPGWHFTVSSLLQITLPDNNLRAYYAAPSMIAFAQVYLAENDEYLIYLDPAYQAYLSEGKEAAAFLITEYSAQFLEAIFQEKVEKFKKI